MHYARALPFAVLVHLQTVYALLVDTGAAVTPARRPRLRLLSETHRVDSQDVLSSSKNVGLSVFKKVFKAIAADPDFSREPIRSDIKLVVGIMDTWGDKKYRQVHRDTWMRLRSVCRPQYTAPARPECSIFPLFVIGNKAMSSAEKWCRQDTFVDRTLQISGPNNCSLRYSTSLQQAQRAMGAFAELSKETTSQQDMIFLHGEPEGINLGKTFAWFEFAVRAYPWATHIAKMDMDVYPFFNPILNAIPSDRKLARGPKCKLEDPKRPAPFQFLGNMFRHFKGRVVHGGPFVMLSYPLARHATELGGRWEKKLRGGRNEDSEMSIAVQYEMKRTCVDFGTPIRNAWLHFGHCGPNGEDSPNHCANDTKKGRATFNYTKLKMNLYADPDASFQF